MSTVFLLPLRRLHGRIHQRNIKRLQLARLKRSLNSSDPKKVYVLGTPPHTNIGDSAIVVAELSFLLKCGVQYTALKEITTSEIKNYPAVLRRITQNDLIVWHGGGNMGNQWINEEYLRRDVLKRSTSCPTIVFPQTIHYTSSDAGEMEKQASVSIYNGRDNMLLVAREVASYKIMTSLYPDTKVLLTPDIVLSADMAVFGAKSQPRKGVLLCMRSDAERSMSDEERNAVKKLVEQSGISIQETDMHTNRQVTKDTRIQVVREKLEQIAGAQVVITDRLHGMIFAAITGTPCIVFSNYNHKVKGTYDWISYLPYIRYAQSAEDVERYLPELLEMKDCKFDNTPLMPYFEKLAEVVRKYACN